MPSPEKHCEDSAPGASTATAAAAAPQTEPDVEFKPTLWTVSTAAKGGDDDEQHADVDTDGEDKSTGGDGDGDGAEGEGGGATDAIPIMSKNAQKRAAKQAVWERRKAAKKAQEKKEKEQRGEEVRAAHKEKIESMTEEERAKYEEEKMAARARRKKEAEEAKAKKQAALTAPNAVILDLEFGHLMQDKEMRSMAKQLTFCYSANLKAQVPVRLYLTGLGGRMGEVTRRACSGMSNWTVICSEESYLETLTDRKKDLVYLTADSEHELEDFKEEDVYIIGGIVDRNRYKNLTLDKANVQGIRHARLPIQNHLKMTGTHVSPGSLLF